MSTPGLQRRTPNTAISASGILYRSDTKANVHINPSGYISRGEANVYVNSAGSLFRALGSAVTGKWTKVNALKGYTWPCCIWTGSEFAAVGYRYINDVNEIVSATSSNVKTWSFHSLWTISGRTPLSIAYGSDTLVAIVGTGLEGATGDKTSALYYSKDNGASFMLSPETMLEDMVLKSVTYGNGKFVAVGWRKENKPGYIIWYPVPYTFVSSDGVTWTKYREPGLSYESAHHGEYEYGTEYNAVGFANGQFYAFSGTYSHVFPNNSGDNKMAVSSDGASWSETLMGQFRVSPEKLIKYGSRLILTYLSNYASTGISDHPLNCYLYSDDNGASWIDAYTGHEEIGAAYGCLAAGGGHLISSRDYESIEITDKFKVNQLGYMFENADSPKYNAASVTYGNGRFAALGTESNDSEKGNVSYYRFKD